MSVALHLARPLEKTPQFPALTPHEFPEFQKSDLRHLHPGVGFDAPEQIRTAPRRQAMTAGSIPQEAEDAPHAAIIRARTAKAHGEMLPSFARLDGPFGALRLLRAG